MRPLSLLHPAVLGLAALLAGCDAPTPSQPAEVPSPVLMGGVSGNAPMDPAEIVEASLEGDVLRLTVRHGGGCRRHGYSLLHSGAFTKSIPPQTFVTLSHDANGDVCEALLTAELAFDLTPLRRLYQNGYGEHGTLVVHVAPPGSGGMPAARVVYVF